MINVSEEVKSLSHYIAVTALEESEYLPIDRNFLDPYVNRILSLNSVEFIFYNIEQVNPTYTNLLFFCLPEVWDNVDIDELEYILSNFTNIFSYYTLIEFTYKYLEIDVLLLIITQAKKDGVYDQVKNYLQNQWNIILQTQENIIELENGYLKDFFHYDRNKWNYIKQKFLLDKRVKPALLDYVELENYIKILINSTE